MQSGIFTNTGAGRIEFPVSCNIVCDNRLGRFSHVIAHDQQILHRVSASLEILGDILGVGLDRFGISFNTEDLIHGIDIVFHGFLSHVVFIRSAHDILDWR